MLAIFKKELSSYFNSTLGYIILAIYLFFSGVFFWWSCFYNSRNNLISVIYSMVSVLYFLVPLMTMKSFAEERRQHTDQALLTAPVGLWEIIFGKYLSAIVLNVMCNLIYVIYALVMIAVLDASIDWLHLLTAMLGITLLSSALLSMNLFFSSLTKYQSIAAAIGAGAGIIIMLYDLVISMFGSVASTFISGFDISFLDRFSLTAHCEVFFSGILSPNSFVFFFSFIALFLFLTNRVLDRKRWA